MPLSRTKIYISCYSSLEYCKALKGQMVLTFISFNQTTQPTTSVRSQIFYCTKKNDRANQFSYGLKQTKDGYFTLEYAEVYVK